MRLEWIEDILAVLDTGSLAGAAQKRFLTQPAFTRRVRMIENRIGVQIFDRSRKPVRLLPGIAVLEPDLRAAAARLRRLRDAMRLSPNASGQPLAFICQHAITATVSPRIVKALAQDGLGAVQVRSGNLDECLMQVLAQEVDFAITYEAPGDQTAATAQAFVSRLLGQDWLIPVCTPAVRALAAGPVIPTIAYPSNAHLGRVFDHRIAPRLPEGVITAPRAETALTLAMLQFALNDIGIAWLPETLAAEALDKGLLVRLDDLLPTQALEIRLVRLSAPDRHKPDRRELIDSLSLPEGSQLVPDDLAHPVKP